ncbi:MAG TPA: chorismate-binding protein, partial [Pyrinomonadaceae bacterium]
MNRTSRQIGLELTADELVAALIRLAPERGACVLDSCGARGDGARFLVAGLDPSETVEARGEELRLRARGESAARVERGSVLSLLDARLDEFRVARDASSDLLPARGACVAALSYDLARQFEKPRPRAPSPRAANTDPDAVLAFFDTLVVHDYARGVTTLVGVGDAAERLEEARATLLGAAAGGDAAEALEAAPSCSANEESVSAKSDSMREALVAAGSNLTRAEYVAAVERIREHIYAGDIYQANLTQQISCATPGGATPERVFLRLRREHPAAFAAFVRLPGGGAVVSASPERFLRVRFEVAGPDAARVVEAWPIKGTRRRGRDAAEDARLRAELLSSAKD